MDNIFHILIKLLKSFNYNISEQEIKERLFSDPDKGVVSITNTLDFFNVQNVVATVPKEALKELPKSFIAQVSNGSQFNLVLITKEDDKNVKVNVGNKPSVIVEVEKFLMDWTGLIIGIEKNEKPHQKNVKELIPNMTFIVSVLLSIFYIGITTVSFLKSIYLALSLIGVYISYLIVKEKLSLDGSSSKFCKISENTDCQSVLNSKEAKLFNIVDLSDASIIYFLFLSLAFIVNPNTNVFKILSILNLPIIVYSIYHQYFKIKKWCPLCLVIAGVLFLQFFLLVFLPNEEMVDFLLLLLIFLIFVLITVSWINLKKLLFKNFENKKLRIENLAFRRNHHLFIPYYNSLQELDISLLNNVEIKLGSKKPLVTILLITNPLCKMCKETHEVYLKLLEQYPDDLQINYRFLVSNKDRNDMQTQISERFLQLYEEESRQVFQEAFNDWYEKRDFKKWINKWGNCNNLKYNSVLSEQVKWCLMNDIVSTPTSIINNKLFPETYSPNDVENFLFHIFEFESNKSQHKT